ncbi:hypothetical protein [Paenibacillus elgii]|uniref:hypothetical protein n=1 Tax=Paenibacillus elgii TaxID=189691 RepID=UPI000248D626|nr:hypothetical protein [Paenibacillus elgii]
MAYEAKTNWQLDDTVTEQDMNRIEQGLKDAYENSMTSPPPEQVNLGYGLQIVDAKRTAPLEKVCIKGRTLVNLLGRDGNCESLIPFTSSPPNVYQGTAALDSANKVYGNNGIKIGIGNGYTLATIAKSGIPCLKNKFYVAIAEVKNGNASNGIRVVLSGGNYGQTVPYQTTTTAFVLSVSKFSSGSSTNLQVDVAVSGTTGQYAYVDGIRLYEITQDEYNAIDSMAPEQIAVKWPYVDDMKNIYSPYIIKYGENLLPPFTEWEMIRTDNGTSILSPYQIKQQTTAIDMWLGTSKIPCTPSTEYTLSMMHTGEILLRFYKKDGTFVDAGGGFTAEYSVSGTSPADVNYIVVYTVNPRPVGTFTFENGMLNVGSKALPFKPRNDDYLFFPNVEFSSNIDGTLYDTLFQLGGKHWKNARFKTIDLDGSLSWSDSVGNYAGYKWIRLSNNMLSLPVKDTGMVTKYDGKMLSI